MNMNQLKQNVILEGKPFLTASRGVRWVAHCVTGREATIQIWPGGPALRLAAKLKAHGSTSLYMKRLEYEPHLAFLAGIARPGMVVLDIGANVGVYATTLAAMVGSEGEVHAFEPGEYSLRRLRFNCEQLNSQLNISIWPVALSDHPGSSTLFHIGGAPTTFSLGGELAMPGEESVELTTLDLWASLHDVSRLDIIKMDVEGHEVKALRGATKTLSTCRPLVMFESSTSALTRNGDAPAGCWDEFDKLGYQIYKLQGERLVSHPEVADGNFYAVHPESPWNDLIRTYIGRQ